MTSASLLNVSKSYGRTPVLENIGLTINSGEFLAVLGPSEIGRAHV